MYIMPSFERSAYLVPHPAVSAPSQGSFNAFSFNRENHAQLAPSRVIATHSCASMPIRQKTFCQAAARRAGAGQHAVEAPSSRHAGAAIAPCLDKLLGDGIVISHAATLRQLLAIRRRMAPYFQPARHSRDAAQRMRDGTPPR